MAKAKANTRRKGSIRERAPGVYEVFVERKPGVDGKRRRKTLTVRGNFGDANREMTRLQREVDTGTDTDDANQTVAQYLDVWLRDHARMRVKAKTLERYAEIVRLHLKPAFGHHKLDKLKPHHIQAAYARWEESGRIDGKGGLSKQTVLHHHRVIHRALANAVRMELLPSNPADRVDPPRPEAQDKAVLDDDQMGQLIRQTKGHRYYIGFLIAVTTGLRRGELCGLRWSDVDLEAKKLTVSQVIGQTKGAMTVKSPKTAKGRRVVDLSPFVVTELTRYKGEQAKARLLLGDGWALNTGLVITLEGGKPIPAQSLDRLVLTEGDGNIVQPMSLSKAFAKKRKQMGFDVTLHGLRHTHASQLMRLGEHIKVVSERLGHSKVGFTLDQYTHLLPTQQEAAAQRLDVVLQRVAGGE